MEKISIVVHLPVVALTKEAVNSEGRLISC